MFPDIEVIHEMLNDIADNIPTQIYNELNGGVLLEEKIKYHPESDDEKPLYVLGEYLSGKFGRSINIYYGSLKKVYEYEMQFDIEDKLKEVLYHELTHHLESLGGEDDLRIEDFVNMEQYRRERGE